MTDRKTPEPGGVYRWYDYPPDTRIGEFTNKVLHIAIPSQIAEGVVRVMCSTLNGAPWSQDYVPAEATLMIPADRGVDVPPGSPRVILRDLPDRLDFSKREHRVVLDNSLSLLVRTAPNNEMRAAVQAVRDAVNEAQRRAEEAARMAEFRQQAKELLKGTIEQRIDRIAELMRQAEDGPEDDDYRDRY